MPDIEYCRFTGTLPTAAVFVAGFRYDAWYRIDAPSGRPCMSADPEP